MTPTAKRQLGQNIIWIYSQGISPVTSQPKTWVQQNSDNQPPLQFKLHVKHTAYSRTNVKNGTWYSKKLEQTLSNSGIESNARIIRKQ